MATIDFENIDSNNTDNKYLDLCKKGRYIEAEPVLLKSLQIEKSILGSDNSDYLDSYEMLGFLYENLNKKINYEDALPIITALTIKKAKKANEKNFRQILNMLILQNTALQKQLNLANEREKTHLSELTSYQQNLTQKPSLTPPIDQGNAQSALENDLNNIGENSQNPMQSESEMSAPNESRNGGNTETESANETDTQPRPTASFNNEMILSESDTSDGEPSRQKNEVIEKKENTFLSSPPSSQNNSKQLQSPNKRKIEAAILPIRIPKNISVTKRKPNANNQSEREPENESIADQDKVNKKDHHDY